MPDEQLDAALAVLTKRVTTHGAFCYDGVRRKECICGMVAAKTALATVRAALHARERAELICATRNALPALLECVEALEEMLDAMDNATSPDEWSTSECRAALAKLAEVPR